MINRLKKLLIGATFVLFAASPVLTLALPTTVLAKPPTTVADCENGILGIPPWFRGIVKLQKNSVTNVNECIIENPNDLNTAAKDQPSNGLQHFIIKVVLNVIEIGLFIAGYAALFFILFGGFLFLTGGANPGQTEKARITLLNAIIGFAISTAAIGAVNLIFNVIK